MTEAELVPVTAPETRRTPQTPLRVTGCLLLLGGLGILLSSKQQAPAEILPLGSVVTAGTPQPPMLPPGYWEQTRTPAAPAPFELVGPPVPVTHSSNNLPSSGSTRVDSARVGSAGAGPIGFIGPISGPLNAQVSGAGPVLGPGWERKPLPNVLAGPPIPSGLQSSAPPPIPSPPDPTSSELPDEKTLALSRLANPQLEVRTTTPSKAEPATAEKPLSVQIALRKDAFRAGDPVSVRVTANLPCFAALVLVDSAGKTSTVFQAARPTREFTCLVKAGPVAGSEYLLAVGSMQPLNAVDIAHALRDAGAGFAPAKAALTGGESAPAAWTLAVAHVDGLDGGARKPQRFEWGSSTATFFTQPAVLTASKPKSKGPEVKSKAPEPKVERPQPAEEDSALPQLPSKPDTKPEAKPDAKPEANPESKPAPVPGTESVLPE